MTKVHAPIRQSSRTQSRAVVYGHGCRRGHLIEILLGKLLLIRKMQESRGQRPLQIVCLSGTLANADEVSGGSSPSYIERTVSQVVGSGEV